MIKFSDLIKSKRNKLNLTLSKLEKETGITASYINRVEKGQVKGVSAENAFKLAEVLDLSMNEVAKSFSVNLKDMQNDLVISSVENPKDYESIINLTKCAVDLSNGKTNYDETVIKIIHLLDKLKKCKCTVIGITESEHSDFAVELKDYNKQIVEIVSRRLKRELGAKIIVIDGALSYYDDVMCYTDLRKFVEDFFDDANQDDEYQDDYKIDKEEINKYIERYY